MANSLQDQLQKSGLIDDKKAKRAERDKRKTAKVQRKTKQPVIDEHKVERQLAKVEKTAKDRQLNQDKNEKAQRKALAAQIKQLIEMNAINKAGDEEFNFADGKKVKRIHVNKEQVERLSRGIFAIVKQGDQYIIVPTPVADKIAERDTSRVIFRAEKDSKDNTEDDAYAEYEIPDDLMW